MSAAVDIVSWILLGLGGGLCVISAIGLHRMPEFYARTHAAGVADSLGAPLMLLGLMFQAPDWLVAMKLVFVGGFLILTSPISSHALVKAAYARGVKV